MRSIPDDEQLTNSIDPQETKQIPPTQPPTMAHFPSPSNPNPNQTSNMINIQTKTLYHSHNTRTRSTFSSQECIYRNSNYAIVLVIFIILAYLIVYSFLEFDPKPPALQLNKFSFSNLNIDTNKSRFSSDFDIVMTLSTREDGVKVYFGDPLRQELVYEKYGFENRIQDVKTINENGTMVAKFTTDVREKGIVRDMSRALKETGGLIFEFRMDFTAWFQNGDFFFKKVKFSMSCDVITVLFSGFSGNALTPIDCKLDN